MSTTDATEALARAKEQADACMDWQHSWAEEFVAALAALGYEVRRVGIASSAAADLDVEALARAIETVTATDYDLPVFRGSRVLAQALAAAYAAALRGEVDRHG